MRTSEMVQNLTRYGITAASISDNEVPTLIAQARSEVDLFVEDRQLKATDATAKLERLQSKTQSALLDAGLNPYEAIHFTRRLGLPNSPDVSGLAFSAIRQPQAEMRRPIPLCRDHSKAADTARFAKFECRDGSIVSIAENALDEFDSQFFIGLRDSKLVSSLSDTVCTVSKLTHNQLIGIKQFSETSTLSSNHSRADLKLLREAAIFIASESMLDAVVNHARVTDFVELRKVLSNAPKKYISLDHLESGYLRAPENEDFSGSYTLRTEKSKISWVQSVDCLEELSALAAAMRSCGFRAVRIDTNYSEVTYKYTKPELSSKN